MWKLCKHSATQLIVDRGVVAGYRVTRAMGAFRRASYQESADKPTASVHLPGGGGSWTHYY